MTESTAKKKINWSLWLYLSFAIPFFGLAAILYFTMPGEYAEIAAVSGIYACPVFALCVFIMSTVTEKWILPGFLSGFLFAGGTITSLVAAEVLDIHSQSYDPDLGHFLTDIPAPVAMYGLPAGFITLVLVWIIRWTIKAGWWTPSKASQ